eukprot:gene3944-4316_t
MKHVRIKILFQSMTSLEEIAMLSTTHINIWNLCSLPYSLASIDNRILDFAHSSWHCLCRDGTRTGVNLAVTPGS